MSPSRIAFVGKGGAGKSVISGAFARLLGRRGTPVLAVDSDPMPGMGFSLGLSGHETLLPDDALEVDDAPVEGRPPPPRLRLSALEAVQRYGATAPDHVRFLQFGKLQGDRRDLFRSQQAFRLIIEGMGSEDWHVVGDLPGGTRQPFFGWAGFADTIVVVAEPTSASLLTARRLARLALADGPPARLVVVANKVRDDADAQRVSDRTGLELVGAVPADPEVGDADRAGEALLDAAPDSRAARAIEDLVSCLAPHP